MRNFIKSFFEKASSAEQLPEPRLSAEQAISLAQEAARKRGYKDPTDKLDHAFLLFRNDALVWEASTSGSIGATLFVSINDATGAVISVELRGLR